MKIVEPDGYAEFVCAASDCPDTCCAAWEIPVDRQTLHFYRTAPGETGNRIRAALRTSGGETVLRTKNGACPLLRDDGLCAVQVAYGAARLCRTCRTYPRFVSEYGLWQERGLSLSCPEVCRRLLLRQAPMTFRTYENEQPLDGCNSIDAALFYALRSVRATVLAMAQDRTVPVSLRLRRILRLSARLQDCAPGDMVQCAARFRETEELTAVPFRPLAAARTIRKWLHVLQRLEILTPQWRDLLRRLCCLFSDAEKAPAPYQQCRAGFRSALAAAEVRREQLLCYYVYKYYLRSAYEGDILGKAKLIAVLFLTAEQLDYLVFVQTGALPSTVRLTEDLHRFARELEHSAPNLAVLKRRLENSAAFSLRRIENLLVQG